MRFGLGPPFVLGTFNKELDAAAHYNEKRHQHDNWTDAMDDVLRDGVAKFGTYASSFVRMAETKE